MFSSSSSLVTENHQRTDVYFPGYFPCEGKYGIQSSQSFIGGENHRPVASH
jgi:hypothetical protein